MKTSARTLKRGLASVAVAGLVFGTAAPNAFGAFREHLLQITGPGPTAPVGGLFERPVHTTVEADGDIWVNDTGFPSGNTHIGALTTFSSSGEYKAQQNGHDKWAFAGARIQEIAVDRFGRLYTADNDPKYVIYVFDPAGDYEREVDLGIGASSVAVDDSGTATDGNVYISGSAQVRLVNSVGDPVNFAGSANYIKENILTGTPTEKFGEAPDQLKVDDKGNLYARLGEERIAKFNSEGVFVTELNFPGGCIHDFDIDPTNGDIVTLNSCTQTIDEFDSSGEFIGQIVGADMPGGEFGPYLNGVATAPNGRVVVSSGGEYIGHPTNGTVDVFAALPPRPKVSYGPISDPTPTSVRLNGHVDPNGGGEVTTCRFEYGPTAAYGSSAPCEPPAPYFEDKDISAELSGLTTETVYHYRLVAESSGNPSRGEDRVFMPHYVPGLSTDPATNADAESAVLHGSFIGNGDDTHYYFEWGTSSFDHVTAAPPGVLLENPAGLTEVEAPISGLSPVTAYQFRIVASNADGTSVALARSFLTPPAIPVVGVQWSTDIHSDSAMLHGLLNAGGGTTNYHFEYGTTTAYGNSVPISDLGAGSALTDVAVKASPFGLSPGVTYHYRLVATNVSGTGEGKDRTFTTFPYVPVAVDPCPNAHARQQTGAFILLDCRAYELVSAPFTEGNDVASDLVPKGEPFGGYPDAINPSRVLYSVEHGLIPGIGNPPSLGSDPYIATRGDHGWTTGYVGLDSNFPPTSQSFSSDVGEASGALNAFLFESDDSCDPCFPDLKAGLPVRSPSGDVVQGMAGSLDPGPTADAGVMVRRRFSSDGRYLLFGSTSQFEPDAPIGEPAIYRRDLESGTTLVVSKTPTGGNIPCISSCPASGVAGLDISDDGSRVLVGQLQDVDAAGNQYWHPYMHIGDSPNSVDLAPGASDGVLYDGMTSDGTKVFISTDNQLTGEDTDGSSDLYLADVGAGGQPALHLVSMGATPPTGNSDGCDPVPNADGNNWNAVGGASSNGCGVVGIGGAGGVSSADGTVFFLSPERLDGSGVQNEPNLFAVRPGSEPDFVATLEPDSPLVRNAVNASGTRRSEDFQVTPEGRFAVFASDLPLTGYDNDGHTEIYRFSTNSGVLDCASCAPTGVRATGDAVLARKGLSVSSKGQVFYTATEPLAPRDLNNGNKDVYEWSDGTVQLISTGISRFNSTLLSAGRDGTDVYFFTRETLVPEDHNGALVKIYDARAGGGFPFDPPLVPCQASDECHGPATVAPPRPAIGTYTGTGGNVKEVRKKHHRKKRRHGNGNHHKRHRHGNTKRHHG